MVPCTVSATKDYFGASPSVYGMNARMSAAAVNLMESFMVVGPFIGDGFELVDFEDAGDLREKTLEEPEVSTSDPFYYGNCLGISEVIRVESPAQPFPVSVQNKEEFSPAEGAVSMGEAKTAVKLGIVPESLIYAGHADEDHRKMGAVVVVTEEFKGCRVKPFGFVDNEQLH